MCLSAATIRRSATMTTTAPPQDSTISKSKVGWSDDTKKNNEDSDENNDNNNNNEHDSERTFIGKIRNVFGLRDAQSENRNGGHVFVDFVQTKPKKRTKISCSNKANDVKIILHKFKADFPEGCVTALMGPSGAGKTTLLDFMLGTLGSSVLASGHVALPDDDAYVPQDDRLHSFYTCQSYMRHYARLNGMLPLMDCCSSSSSSGHLPVSNNKMDVDALIADILSEVGLTAQKNTVVGGMFQRGLSGGQKRRLSVALEALSSPLNLFLDEPTSGLDSESALAVVQYLQSYARGTDPKTGRRRRVILTIHQPSSQIWERIDNVVLMAEGRLMYQGPRTEMTDFFATYGHPVPPNYNMADHAIEVLFKEPKYVDGDTPPAAGISKPQMWNICFNKWMISDNSLTEFYKEMGLVVPMDSTTVMPMDSTTDRHALLERRKSTVFRREDSVASHKSAVLAEQKLALAAKKTNRTAIELLRRSFTSLMLNPVVLGFCIAVYTVMALTIGILFFHIDRKETMHAAVISRAGLLYFIVGFLTNLSLAQIPFAILDRGIGHKEIRNHRYHPAINHAAMAFTSTAVCFILAAIVAAIVLPMTGLRPPYIDFVIILFLSFVCGDAMTMLVAHISPELISAICISSGIVGVFIMVMGFLVLHDDLPRYIRWSYYLPFMTYSFRSLMFNEFQDLPVKFNETDMKLFALMSGEANNIFTTNATFTDGTIPNSILEIEYCTDGICTMTDGGNQVLEMFQMDKVNVMKDMIILAIWACVVHAMSIIYLSWTHFRNERTFVYSDRLRK